jgi:protein-tyrosine phosphatase
VRKIVRPPYWPRNGQPYRTTPFTWIVKNRIAASWWPDDEVFEIYRQEGVKVIINCSEFDNYEQVPKEFHYYHISIPDYGIPTDFQIEKFLDITNYHREQNESIVVHCVAGCGRTGQMIVIWGAYNNQIPKGIDPVDWIRSYRKCCLETREQKNFAREIAKKLQD